ncbi:uncharacterized protein LOC143342133 isoform X2 [Colletes latitarsis]|uniref:uncharacterized protein LOC143342133 isoform X2 n=1 Tax=Colletes latitarsis TaxID=2605962 RepID=UPI004035E3E3
MRRTRHVALPVRAWQYVGLLIVSLACLTLGLVSRDKEGRAGSLAGPELEHRAPHEVDACPNLSPFTKLPSCSILEQDPARVPKISGETASVRSSQIPADRRISRSRNLDRVSQTRMQSRTDCKSMERLARQGPNVDNDSSRLVRLSRSLNLDDARLTTRSLDRRSHAGRRLVDQREHREASAIGKTERRERLGRSNSRFDIRDRRSHSVERRGSIVSERIDRNDRLEIRERRARSLERRTPNNLERRVNGKLENVREDRRNRIVHRIEKRIDDRRSVSRASIRQHTRQESRSNSEENRQNVRSGEIRSSERQDSGASRDQDKRSLIRTTENTRRLDSRFPGDIERTTMTRRVNKQTSRSLDRGNSRTAREHEASREQKPLVRSTKPESTDFRRESTSRNVEPQDRKQPIARRESRSNLDHRFLARTEQRDASNQRRGTIVRMDRRLNARLNERRATSLTRSSERSRMDNTERRENNWLNLVREKRDSERLEKEEKRSTVAESVNKQDSKTNRWLVERSRNDNVKTSRLHLTRESRTPISRLSETVKRDSERRVRELSNDRRSSERKSPVSESAIRREVRTDRRLSTLNSVERRETNRLNLAHETVKRDSERRVRDLSNDRRSSERKSTVSEPAIRRESRTDSRLSSLNSVERRERTSRLNLARETIKRDTERRVRDLSNDRRSSERKPLVSESAIRGEVRTDRRLSTLNSVERRERTNRLNLARETVKRDSERRLRDLSNDRRSSERKSPVSEPIIRQEVRTDRRLSTLNSVERRERTNRLNLARETIKRDTERSVRDLSNDRRSSERKSPVSESAIRREVRTDRRLSTLNSVERRERTSRLNLARETIKRDSERRVRDLSNDRRSSERKSTVSEPAIRREVRTDSRLSSLNSVERRERTNRLNLARETVKRDTERRVRDLSNDRRSSERKSTISEPAIRREVRTDRRLSTLNSVERRERTNRLNLARETVKRDSERRVRDLSNDRRSSERTSPVSESAIRREVRTDRRLSTLNSVERRERTNRSNLVRETIKRDSERRLRDLSNDRRSLERTSPVSESEIRRESRTDSRLSSLNNVERREKTNRLNLARETIKRDSERRVRDLSNDRRSSERKSTISEPAIRREVRTDRRLSTLNSVERRERTNRLNLARETIKRDSERRVRDLSNDRRSSERKSTISEPAIRREVRTDRRLSTLNSVERRERTNRLNLARETIKRDSERRVRDLSNDRRSSERTSPVSESAIRREVRTDRRLSSLNTIEHRERTNKLNIARESQAPLTRLPETANRDSERRVRNLSNDRLSTERRSTILESARRQDIRTDRRLSERSRLNGVERRERTNTLYIARESRIPLTRSYETVKRDLERRVRNLSNDRLTTERRSTMLESARRQDIRTDRRLSERSRLNGVERRERTNTLYIARESRIPLTRSYETAKRDLERRVRNLSNDRLSTERRSTILESARRQDIRTDRRLSERSRLNGVERRERTNTLYIARESRLPLTRSYETAKRDLERRVRNLSNDRLSTERRSTILESARRQDIRTDRRLSERSRLNGVERRERTNTLYIARESRIPLTRSYETAKRDLERRVRDLSNDRRSSERRSTVFEFGNHEEVRTDRRSRLITLERRGKTSRYLTRESETPPTRSSETANHDLARRVRHSSNDRRLERRQLVDSKRYSEATVLEHLNNQKIETERSRQRSNVNRLQRTRSAILTNDPRSNQREQRLTEKTRVLLTTLRSKPLNDMKRSRLANQRLIRFSDKGSRIFSNLKDSVDSNTQKYVKSSRVSTISDNDRSFATRESLLSRINAYRTTTVDIPNYLKEENSMKYALTFEVLQQALVIGLCALYSLSIFRGKQSFVSTVVRQASRIILW